MKGVDMDLGDGLRLRHLRRDDAAAVTRLVSDRRVWLNLRDVVPHPYTQQHGRDFVDRQVSSDDPDAVAIVLDGELVGLVGAHPMVDVHRYVAEVGYWLGVPYWGQGIATRALRAVVDHVFATTELLRLEAHVFSSNPASARVVQKAGFTLEGVLRASVVKDGRVLDRMMWAKLRPGDLPDTWPARGER